MGDKVTRLKQRLSQEGEKAAGFFAKLEPAQLDQMVYTDGACWKVRQVLAHFVSAEANIGWIIADIYSGGQGAPENLDIDEFNEQDVPRYEGTAAGELIERFLKYRRRTASLISSMNEEDLARQGRHPYLGITSIEEIAKLLYIHNQIHIRDIRSLLHQYRDQN
ncbi:MAG: DinB family protein [Omnitrophica WOR_2 bacterium]